MIASLMMYKNASINPAIDRYWSAIRDELISRAIDCPSGLSQEVGELEVWRHPQLVLSQTCGMPYRLWLQDAVSLVGTPDYGLDGCAPGYYRSAIVVRANDTRDRLTAYRDARFAFNKTWSQSGYSAAHAHAAKQGFWFGNRIQTGQHLASARAVANDQADIAFLDAVTWLLMQRHSGFDSITNKLRVLDWTVPTPGLPYITSASNNASLVFGAVSAAIAILSSDDCAALSLNGIVRIDREQYLAVPNPPGEDYPIPA